jgi:hypothetical protein
MRDAERRFYTELHEGREPAWVGHVPDPKRYRVEYELGELHSVTYRKATPEGNYLYKHDFAPHARPELVTDERGSLHVRGGAYTTTTRGITDHEPGATRMKRYAQAPRKNPQSETRETPRDNPSENEMTFWKNVGVIGGTVGVGTFAGDLALRKTKWGVGARGLAQAVVGAAVGYALRARYPTLATGFAVYGIAAGIRGAAQQYNLQRYLTAGPSAAPTSTTTTTSTTTPTTNPATGLPSPAQGARLHTAQGGYVYANR